jgi:hypothetical protein
MSTSRSEKLPYADGENPAKCGDGLNHVALAVDDNDTSLFLRNHLKIMKDKMLKKLCLAMPRTTDNVHMFKARLEGDRERQRSLTKVSKRRSGSYEARGGTIDLWTVGGIQFATGEAYSYVVLVGTGSVTEPWASGLGAGYVTAPLVNALLEDLTTLQSPQSARAGPGAVQAAHVQ